jgi:CRISPR/Cas system CSM-associated protein Csm2 small subunit
MEKNILFELSRIKCELVYLNNPKKKKEANKMTKLLKTNFTEIYLDEEPKDSIPYLFNFYEQNQIYHNMLMLTG